MIPPHGFRRLCLTKRPAKTAVDTEQRRFCSRAPRTHLHLGRRRILCLRACAHNQERQLCKMTPCSSRVDTTHTRHRAERSLGPRLLDALLLRRKRGKRSKHGFFWHNSPSTMLAGLTWLRMLDKQWWAPTTLARTPTSTSLR